MVLTPISFEVVSPLVESSEARLPPVYWLLEGAGGTGAAREAPLLALAAEGREEAVLPLLPPSEEQKEKFRRR